MATYEPAGATGYSAGDAEDVDNATDTAPPIPFPDPFGPYPDRPYPGVESTAQPPPTPALTGPGAALADDTDPPTDPTMAPVTFDDGFDPFAADAFWFPERPWYRKRSATVAFAAIGIALVAMLVAAVLLVSRVSDESGGSTGTTSSTTAPTTTPLTSSPPPQPPLPPPPPPVSSPEAAQTPGTWAPQYPQYPRQNGGDRPNVTTPQTRPPQISVRPSHRPAFPNQPGGG